MNLDDLTERELIELNHKLIKEAEAVKIKMMLLRAEYHSKLDRSVEIQKELRYRALQGEK